MESFQSAFDKNVAFWTGLPYTTMPKPAKPATNTEGEYVVLLRAFIDLYMNQLRLGQSSQAMVDFVAALPGLGNGGQEPRAALPGLLELFGAMLQPNDASSSPSTLAPLAGAKVVLDVFGSTLRAALYSSDVLQTLRAAMFVAKYVQIMAGYRLPYRVALAVLARDLILADDNDPTEAQVQAAAATLQRFVVVLDQTPTLSDALDLLSGLAGSKFQFESIDEMAPHVYLDLLVSDLGRDHAALRTFCSGRAGRFRQDIGARMAVLLEQITLLLAAAGRVDAVSLLIPWVRRRAFQHRLGFLPYLALFWDRNRSLLDRMVNLELTPFEKNGVLNVIREALEKAPAMVLDEEIHRLALDSRLDSVEWPQDWPELTT